MVMLQMTYVFINPVTDRMTSPEILEQKLCSRNMHRVYCRENWSERVLEEYSKVLMTTDRTVLDMRCPMAVDFVRTLKLEAVREAPVLPILLHCAEELSQREDLQNGQILITTPCRALEEQGNMLALARTTFITAKKFLADIGYNSATPIMRSPIPPGFFDPLSVNVVSATGEKEIAKEAVNLSKGIRLFEMLFCLGGCHNGDGI